MFGKIAECHVTSHRTEKPKGDVRDYCDHSGCGQNGNRSFHYEESEKDQIRFRENRKIHFAQSHPASLLSITEVESHALVQSLIPAVDQCGGSSILNTMEENQCYASVKPPPQNHGSCIFIMKHYYTHSVIKHGFVNEVQISKSRVDALIHGEPHNEICGSDLNQPDYATDATSITGGGQPVMVQPPPDAC
eukprot:1477768-Amphidinium_carterae.1